MTREQTFFLNSTFICFFYYYETITLFSTSFLFIKKIIKKIISNKKKCRVGTIKKKIMPKFRIEH